MTFAYTARGSKDQAIASLLALSESQMGNDPLGITVRDMLVQALRNGSEPVGRYYVHASGEGRATDSPATLSITVSTDGLRLGDTKHQIGSAGTFRLPPLGLRDTERQGSLEHHRVLPVVTENPPPDWPA